MATVKIKLTKDLLALISNIRFKKLPDLGSTTKQELNWCIDFFSLYGGNFALEDISYILGRYDEHIQGTEENPMGPQFPKESEDYMWGLHEYIVENIKYIESLVHWYSNKGGLKEGTYKCKDYEMIWSFVEDKKPKAKKS